MDRRGIRFGVTPMTPGSRFGNYRSVQGTRVPVASLIRRLADPLFPDFVQVDGTAILGSVLSPRTDHTFVTTALVQLVATRLGPALVVVHRVKPEGFGGVLHDPHPQGFFIPTATVLSRRQTPVERPNFVRRPR